jgi:hypothetical protein
VVGVGAPWPARRSSSERGKSGKEEGWGGAGRGRHGGCQGCHGEGLLGAAAGSWLLCAVRCAVGACCTWEEDTEEREKKRKEKEGKGKKERKRKKYGKFLKLENFWKIKDNLWCWSKIIFVQERNKPNYN